MKPQYSQLPSSSSNSSFFDLSLPKSWADLSDPQLLFFFRQLATDKPMRKSKHYACANGQTSSCVAVCTAAFTSGKQQATLTLHQFVCAITALDFLKSFPPYPIRIRTIGKARPMEADFQGVPFTSFISHRQLRPLPSLLSVHLCHRVLHSPHR